LAYLDRKGVFQIVEASSGEKGPYRSLAEGALTRHDGLAITIHDEGAPVCEITFSDWAAQAGMTLSPTAGWGLPVNAIEFRLLGDGPQSAAALFMTLAGTSVGRGWDTVGHSAGIYRNRIRVEELS
jgi:hypothetical protein